MIAHYLFGVKIYMLHRESSFQEENVKENANGWQIRSQTYDAYDIDFRHND